MKSKLILAAIAAPLLFGGMQTSALAGTSYSYSYTWDESSTEYDRYNFHGTDWTISPGMYIFALALTSTNSWFSVARAMLTNWSDAQTFEVETSFLWPNDSASASKAITVTGPENIHVGASLLGGTFSGSMTAKLSLTQVSAVPGPEAGAGLGALALGGMALWLKRRRKDEALAA